MQDLLRDAKYTLEWNGTDNPNDFVDPDLDINFKGEVNFMEPDEFIVNEGSQDHADQMYNKLSKEVNVIKRRFQFSTVDHDDLEHGFYGIEKWKEYVIRRNFLQFLIHTRYEVGKALRQREPIRSDRRYQIGYLFNRLRRIKTEQLKLLYYLHNKMRHRTIPWGHWFRYYHVYFVADPFLNHLMIYEKLTAFDVDIKDTINYIREIYSKKESYDYVEIPPTTETLL
ncbi:unnamed protein product [Arctia plantaginis]|uniref:Uncharacterized protein n=1 Tax=Arctia plantaginis TaxID=874455 RepID=A0A8S0YMT5_ARCPL|nr:unnamed protein product [Arctia plantaginis]